MKLIVMLMGLALCAFPLAAQNVPSHSSAPSKHATRNEGSLVLQKMHHAKTDIQRLLLFPANEQDTKNAGLLFGRLLEVMVEYNNLRKQNPQEAQKVGAVIAREEFISKDGVSFFVGPFIEQYVHTIRPATARYVGPSLADEFVEFKDNIDQDAGNMQ